MEKKSVILVVDDDPVLRETAKSILEEAGYEILSAKHGEEALGILRRRSVHLIISDVSMPHMNGYQLLEKVQKNPKWVMTPFILLTNRSLNSDIRYGKGLGVDDYLSKPINSQDLLAVVKGKLQRFHQIKETWQKPKYSMKDTILNLGPLQIDTEQYIVSLDGELLNLTTTEFELLTYFGRNPHRVIPMQELLQVTHGIDADYSEASNLIRPIISALRQKLNVKLKNLDCIITVRGVGYRFSIL